MLSSCSEDGVNTEKPDSEDSDPIIASDFSLQNPINEAINIEQGVTLEWSNAGEGIVYRLLVSTNEDLSNPIIDQSDITSTTYVVKDILTWDTSIYWTVYATNVGDNDLQAHNGTFSFDTMSRIVPPSPTISRYYVSTDGVDKEDNGSFENPFKSIAFASKNVPEQENDTIFILNGTYKETEPTILSLGTNLIGESTEGVIIQSSGVELPKNFELGPNDRVEDQYQYALVQMVSDEVVDGSHELAYFTLDGMLKQLPMGIWAANRNNISIHHITVKNVNFRGMALGTSIKPWFRPPETYIQGIHIHNCNFENSGQDLEEYSTGNLNLGQLENAHIYDISIVDDKGYGLKFLWDGYFKNCHFHDIKTNLNETDRLWGEDIGIELWNLGPGNVVEDVQSNTWLSLVNHPFVFPGLGNQINLKIKNTLIIDGSGSSTKEGLEIGVPHSEISGCYIENKSIGIALWDMGHNNVLIHHNILRNDSPIPNWAGGSGIYIDNSRNWDFENIRVFNNIFDSFVYGVRVKGERVKDISLKNNLFIDSSNAELYAENGDITFTHNYRHTVNGTDWSIFGDITALGNNPNGDALITAFGNRKDTFYKPLENSPLIDAGKNVGFPFNSDAPDIGAFEY